MNRKMALLCIDPATKRVRRYAFIFDAVRATAEFELPDPQPPTAVLVPALEMARKTTGMPEEAFT